MNTFPSLVVQKILFFVPYFFTALTCVILLCADMGDGGCRVLRLAGWINSGIMLLYLSGLLGPHYLKLGCGIFNCSVVTFLMISYHWWSAAALFASYVFPAIIFVTQAIFVPSISEILPRVYVGNRASAQSVVLLQHFEISHILDLSSSLEDAWRVNASRQRPECITVARAPVCDFLGSHGSLDEALEECMKYMSSVLSIPNATVLVHCSAGQSRSGALLLHFLMEKEGLSLRDAYAFLRRRRPVVDISSDHMSSLHEKDLSMSRTRNKDSTNKIR